MGISAARAGPTGISRLFIACMEIGVRAWKPEIDVWNFARRIGGAYLIGAGISMQGWANYMLGNHEEGIALLKEGFRVYSELRIDSRAQPCTPPWLLIILLWRGCAKRP